MGVELKLGRWVECWQCRGQESGGEARRGCVAWMKPWGA